MPLYLLRSYAENMPTLEAREELRMIEAVALGRGGKGEARRRALADLERAARAGEPRRKAAGMTREMRVALLGSMGIGVEIAGKGEK